MRDPRSRSPRSRRRSISWLAGGALLLAAGRVTGYWLLPTPARIERRWEKVAGFEPRVVYPLREANAAARRIEALIAPVGFAISRYVVPIGGSAAGVRSGRPSAAHSEVMDYVHALRRVEPVLSPPTSSLAEFLRDTEPTLDEIARVLAGPEPPRWEARIDRRTDDLGPYWIDHLHLHRLLVAAAAQAEHRGQSASAQRWIDAAWRLRESLDDSPSVIEQLVALAELHDEVALLRAIPRPLPGWERRLAPLPLRRRLMTAARLEAWGLAGALRQYLTEDLPDWVEAPPTVLARPQARRGVATVVASMDRAARRLESADSRPSDAVRVVAEELDSTPRWNVVARTLWSTPLVGEVWRKAARAELNLS